MQNANTPSTISPANRLGLNYHQAAHALPWPGRIHDVHTHIRDAVSAEAFCRVADVFNIDRIWTMTNVEEIDGIRDLCGDRIRFIAVPNYQKRFDLDTFRGDWLERIERFAAKGVKICKFWAAPRGRDFHPDLTLDSPWRKKGMALARQCGMMIMVHIADPDTWFATHYKDHHRYGTKLGQYDSLYPLLEEYHDVPWWLAHMGGYPEDLDFMQRLLDRYPQVHLDTSATKWMVRELSKHPDELRDFLRRNPGRVMFGTDIVASPENMDFDLYASRYWTLRTLFETDYEGESPIVDPDLSLLDPSLPADAAPMLRGAKLDAVTLDMVYRGAAERLLLGL